MDLERSLRFGASRLADGMLRSGNMAARQMWMGRHVLPVAFVLVLVAATAVQGDDGPAGGPELDWSHAQRAHRQIERWVRLGAVQQDNHAEPIAVTGLAGVRVTLRRFGQTLAVGTAVVEPLAADDRAAIRNLSAMARTACASALRNATESLRAMNEQAGLDQDNQPRVVPALAALAAFLTVDLQVARLPEPISLTTGSARSAKADVYRQFAAGYHGLRLAPPPQSQDAAAAWSWPVSNLAANLSPKQQMAYVMRRLGDRGYNRNAQLQQLVQSNQLLLQRFEVIHITRASIDQPVERLIRGNMIVPLQAISEPTLDAMTQRLSAHLLNRQDEDGSFSGTFNPTADRFKSPKADAEQVALTAYALMRYAKLPGDDEQIDALHDAVRRAASFVNPLLLDPDQPAPPRAMALMMMTIMHSPGMADRKADRDEMARRLAALLTDGSRRVDATTHAMVLAALAELFDQTRDEALRELVATQLDLLWQRIGDDTNIAALPWLSELHLHFGLPDKRDDVEPAASREQRLAGIVRMIGELRRGQITGPPQIGPEDVLGGFDVAGKPALGAPQPDWRTAQGLIIMAIALRHSELMQQQDPLRWQIDCMRGARFLGQLMFTEPSCFYVRNPSIALGGIRASLHDNTLHLGATAAALLAVTEFRQSLAVLAGEAEIR